MVALFQVIFIIFSLVAAISVAKKLVAGEIGRKGMFFWVIFWLLADVAVIWPNSTTLIANHLGIGRGTDFVMYVSIAAIFYLIFRLHVKVEAVGRDITKVIREETLGKKSIDKNSL